MPRGSGKTTFALVAALWAVLYGHHGFVLLIAANATKAKELLVTIKTELRTNAQLAADFPEAIAPILALEGITNRAAGQRFNGQPTYITWTDRTVVLPTIPSSPASGAIIRIAGLLGGDIRGQQWKRADGSTVRPSLALADDPQTSRSAKSPSQCDTRERILKQDVLRAAGPGKSLALVACITVIVPGDLSDRLLNPELSPGWTSLRCKTLYAFPTNLALWEEYHARRLESQRVNGDDSAATAFYRKNRKAMDAGAIVAWPENHKDDELSAIETAMKAYLEDRQGFAAEFQNEPQLKAAAGEVRVCTAAQIAEKVNHIARGQAPLFATHVNAFIDVSQDVLWFAVCAWSQDFDGAIVDYGAWPDQARPYYTLHDLAVTIADELGDGFASLDEQLFEALDRLTKDLFARKILRTDGEELRISQVIIDAGFETETVKRFCRESASAAMLLPSHGRGITARDTPISCWQRKPGQKRGEEWVIGKAAEARGSRHLTFDSNHWKTQTHKRLATNRGGRGSLELYGDRPAEHRMVADHLAAEGPLLVKAKGREVAEWKLPPSKPDNHLGDCVVGCAVGASIAGASILGHKAAPPKPPRAPRRDRVSYL